jgi:hypothetical protein
MIMKARSLTKLVLALGFALSGSAFAQSGGVKCPDGFSPDFNSDKVLRCVKTENITRTSICPPINNPNYTQMESAGSDRCKPQVVAQAGASLPSAMLLLPGDPPSSAFTREVVENGMDKFNAQKRTYAYPQGIGGLAVFVGDASRGVRCANIDSNDRVTYEGGVLKCKDVKKFRSMADCNIGWRFSKETGEDRCINPVGGRDATKPEGQLNASGWTLKVDDDGKQDYWTKTESKFEWPVAR